MEREEQEAIEYLQNQDNSLNWNYGTLQAILQVLNYIDKLQKENEALKEVHKEFATLCRELKTDDTLMSAKSVMEKVVSKDKIRTKIKELEEQQAIEIEETGMSLLSVPIRILEELLGDDE